LTNKYNPVTAALGCNEDTDYSKHINGDVKKPIAQLEADLDNMGMISGCQDNE